MYDKLKADVAFLNSEYEAAADMYLEGAREGDALASFNYGYCLLKGLGRSYDPKEAKTYFSFAKNLEGGASEYNLAVMYLHGEGVKRNYERARDYMIMSAEDGCLEAQLYMGMAYTLGCMFEPDIISICMIPYHKTEYRDITTPLISGFVDEPEEEDMRFSVVRADARAAFEWFQTASRHDSTYVEPLVAKGKYLYAKCYIDGLGTDFDREKGTRLMLMAGKSGSYEAVAFLKENGITPQMILEAARKKR